MENRLVSEGKVSAALRNAIRFVHSNPGMYEMLGSVPDEEIAEHFGCKLNRVKRYRRILGIKFRRGRGMKGGVGENSSLSDDSVVPTIEEFAEAASMMDAKRKGYITDKYEAKYPGIISILGTVADQVVGDRYGITRESVRLIRNKFGIKSAMERGNISLQEEKLLVLDSVTATALIELNKFLSENLTLLIRASQSGLGEE